MMWDKSTSGSEYAKKPLDKSASHCNENHGTNPPNPAAKDRGAQDHLRHLPDWWQNPRQTLTRTDAKNDAHRHHDPRLDRRQVDPG